MHVSLFLTTVISSTQQRTRLRHKASGRIVCVVAMHLMTTSRDGPGVTRFPGEVRAGELATIKSIVAERAARDDAVVLCGDLCGNQPVRRVHDDEAVLARSSGEERAPPRHRAGVASMALRTTR